MSQSPTRPALLSQNTAATEKTVNSMATAKTQQTRNPEFNLAGPSLQHFKHMLDAAYFEAGYEDVNPWMKDDTRTQEFSLARVFPREVRWEGPYEPSQEQKSDHVQVDPEEKGETEPATQVTEAQDQRQRLDSAEDTEVSSKEKEQQQARLGDPASHGRNPPTETRPLNTWAHIRHRFHRPLAEWLGTTLLVFIGCSSNLAVVTSQYQSGSAQTTYWCWGFAVMLGIYVSGGSSGAFLNPALTIMLHIFRGFPGRRITIYILAQCFGAFNGALLAFAMYRDAIYHLDGALLPESTGILLYTQPLSWVSPATAFFSEFLGSAVIGCCILALGDSANSPPGAGMHAFIIGLLVTTCTMSFSYNTKGAFNPARDIGPRLAAIAVGYPSSSFTAYHNWWIWGPWIACILGALTGGLVYDVCIFRGGESPVNYSFQRYKLAGLKQKARYLRAVGRNKGAEGVEKDVEQGLAEDSEARGES